MMPPKSGDDIAGRKVRTHTALHGIRLHQIQTIEHVPRPFDVDVTSLSTAVGIPAPMHALSPPSPAPTPLSRRHPA